MPEKKIGTMTFRCEKMLATESLLLQARMARMIGPGLQRFMAAASAEETEDAAGNRLVDAFAEIFQRNKPEEVVTLLKDIASIASVRTESGAEIRVNIDELFTDDMPSLLILIAWVVEVQFRDFFTALLATGNQIKKRSVSPKAN